MRIFPLALKDRSKEWYKSIGQEFNSWNAIKKCFLRKSYSFVKKQMPLGELLGNLLKIVTPLVKLDRGLWHWLEDVHLEGYLLGN